MRVRGASRPRTKLVSTRRDRAMTNCRDAIAPPGPSSEQVPFGDWTNPRLGDC